MPLSIRRDDLLPGRNFIGRWCEAEEGRRFDVTDPATDTVFASVPDSGAADARAALDAAQAAFAGWRACRRSSAHRFSSAGTTWSLRTRKTSGA
jgi:succinate-semialdehyde dehydrogenase/glutarate-semialdehyde dehydrogenase